MDLDGRCGTKLREGNMKGNQSAVLPAGLMRRLAEKILGP